MKITKQDLVQLIKEELDTMLAEGYEERMRDIARNKAHYDSGAADYLRGGSGWGGGVVDTRDFVRGAKQALKKAGPMLGAAAGGAAAYGALDAMAAERAKLKGPAVPQASWEDAINQDRERRGESSPTEIAGETIGGLFGGSEEVSGGDMTPELRARYGLKEKIQYELTKLLKEPK